MEDEAPVIYGLEFQARALAAQAGETDQIRFIVGTQSLRQENQVHHIDFDDENNVINKNVFMHREGEMWHISASTVDKSLLTTCYNKTSESKAEMRAALWRLPGDFDDVQSEDQSSHQSLSLVCHLDATDYGDMKSVMWHPTGDNSNVVGLADNHIVVWDIDTSGNSAQMTSSAGLESKGQPKLTCSSWDPHHNCVQIATANDTFIRGWDLRTMQQTYVIENAHGQLVRDVDFNPNKQYYIVSCGDDCKVKFWDIRNVGEPLKVLSDHSHWVWSVRYNRFHDQLVLSSSSDSRVILNNIVSLSSEPYGNLIENDEDDDDDADDRESREASPPQDGVIATYEEHEDSVYTVDWSTADPWVFASLSYDGRLVINRVPRAEKYKILL
ncbi:EARP and GARP complex-interacting protein 1-like isoform X1 [Mercenaria mercenaria]|uniref:EARP and GARP complex-interacting protein 1-like isoform X1 n=2 Tax=Mercenaria mercenaria TaxID=6596 RepID=UPI00234F29FD|nr:EARP and GARP complex-interacting protein 1-like isoform X1 [Mercenaria mercenaria]